MSNDLYIKQGVLISYTGREELVTVPEHVHTIGEGAFKACVSLKKVILPSGLCRILSGAFKGCRKLREIQIPPSVSYLGDYAFHRCHSLECIFLPPSVKELGDCVFLYCDSLTRVHIPGVKRLGKQVFVNDVLLKELELSPHLKEDCICDVFTGCSRITHISLASGQTFIIPNAVEAVAGEMDIPSLVRAVAMDILRMMELNGRCLNKFLTNLKHVELPEGIEKIGKSCFFDKRGILSVTLPASLKEIESRAFRNCISLESVVFRQDQVLIHDDAFKNCTSLREISTADGCTHKIEGISAYSGKQAPALVRTIHQQVLGNFRLSGTILLKYLGNESRVVVPHGVTVIAEEAFAGKEAIDRVILPDSLREIGTEAFRDCLLLQVIDFPPTLTRIGAGAFQGCVKLLRALLPEKLTLVDERVFKRCRRLKEVLFPAELQGIGDQAFYGCQSLSAVHFPDRLTRMGEMAFYRCNALKEIRLPSALESIGNLAFAQSGIRKVRIQGSGRHYGNSLFFGCLSLRTVILDNGVCHIPDRLACGCTALTQVILPDTLESVGRNVWEYTPFLENWIAEYPVSKDNAIFWDGRSLSGDVHLPKETRIIAGGAFYGNTALTGVDIPDCVAWIGPASFKGCCCLRYAVWPLAVTTAETEVFSGCTSLENVECAAPSVYSVSPALGNLEYLDNSDNLNTSINTKNHSNFPVPWTYIKERAFYRCEKLNHLSLTTVKSIEKEGFYGCISFIPGEANALTKVGEAAFGNLIQNAALAIINHIVISGPNLTGEVHLPEGITAIAPFAFSRNQQITKLFLPNSLRHIEEGAFWGCSELTEIHFPSVSCTVGARAFEKCTSLSQVSLYACEAGPSAFAFCLSLKQAEIQGLSVLESRLFEGCASLEQCISEQALVIKPYCFSGCSRLKDFNFSLIREIGSYGFQHCDGLRSISLNGGTLLLPHAFEDCGCLEQICLSESQDNLALCEYAFSGCTALKQVIWQGQIWELRVYRDILSENIPEPVRRIFHSAFSCFAIDKEEILQSYRGLGRIIRIPEGIRRIEAEVFRNLPVLEQVSIPETVEYIGARAFHGTAWMEKQRRKSPMVIVNHMLLDGACCEGEVIVSKDIRLICGWAFAGGMGIEKIRFLSKRVNVEAHAFRNCIYLKELVLADGSSIRFQGISDRQKELPPLAKQAVMDSLNCFKTDNNHKLVECTGNISRLLLADGITAIGDRVFQDGNLLTQITLPPTVTSIGKFSFAGCKWLKRVKQAQNITNIEERAFFGCGVLEEIESLESLNSIGTRAFENCTSLKEILLPEGIEEIPDRAFFRCHSLQYIQLPSTLKRIGKEAFAFCKNLRMPQIPEGVSVENRAFAGIYTSSDKVCSAKK